MLKVNPHILTTLRHRFDEQVSEADILAWLYNFDEADWTVALTLLNQVSFILKQGVPMFWSLG